MNIFLPSFREFVSCLIAIAVLPLFAMNVYAVTWDDGAGAADEWNASSFANWDDDDDPSGKPVVFGDAGTAGAAGTTTNILDTDYTISSLTFNHDNGQFHTTDLDGNTLTVSGALVVGQNGAVNSNTSHATIDGGTLDVLGSTRVGTLNGRFGELNLSSVTAAFGDDTASDVFYVGEKTSNSGATPIGTYAQTGGSLSITASELAIGKGAGSGNHPATGMMTLTDTATSIVTGGSMHVGHNGTGDLVVSGGSFDAEIGGDLIVGRREGSEGNISISGTSSASLKVDGSLLITTNYDPSANNDGSTEVVALPAADVTIGDGVGTDRILIGVGNVGQGNAGRPSGRYTQDGGTLAINVSDFQLGVGGSGNQGSYGSFEATNMTSTSIVTSGDWVVGNENASGGPNLQPENANVTISGGTFTGQIGGNLDVMATSSGSNSARPSLLDLSGITFDPAGFHIAGDMRVGLVAEGTARLGDGSNPDPLAPDVTAAALSVGGNASNDIGLVALHGTRFAVNDPGGLTLGDNGSIELLYDTTSGFDPVDAWLRVPLGDESLLQDLINDGQILAFVDDVQQDTFMGETFGVFSNSEFSFAAFALPQSAVIPEPASIFIWIMAAAIAAGCLWRRRVSRA